jgi:hypothetical protein
VIAPVARGITHGGMLWIGIMIEIEDQQDMQEALDWSHRHTRERATGVAGGQSGRSRNHDPTGRLISRLVPQSSQRIPPPYGSGTFGRKRMRRAPASNVPSSEGRGSGQRRFRAAMNVKLRVAGQTHEPGTAMLEL